MRQALSRGGRQHRRGRAALLVRRRAPPEVVLYEEPLAERDITDAVNFIRKADVLIVGGTSLAVYPAAGLLRYYEGRKLALVNMGATSYDESADLLIREKIGKVFSEV